MDDPKFRLLGPFEVACPLGSLKLGSRRERALLALLALRAGEHIPFANLVEELWGEVAPANVEATLRTLLSRVRRALSERGFSSILVRERAAGYRLEVTPDIVDALAEGELLGEQRRSPNPSDVACSEPCCSRFRRWRCGAQLVTLTQGPNPRLRRSGRSSEPFART
ncbi:MAG: AfsR/SARP family transcriptional regulator [Acidimicrobiia bacterium]